MYCCANATTCLLTFFLTFLIYPLDNRHSAQALYTYKYMGYALRLLSSRSTEVHSSHTKEITFFCSFRDFPLPVFSFIYFLRSLVNVRLYIQGIGGQTRRPHIRASTFSFYFIPASAYGGRMNSDLYLRSELRIFLSKRSATPISILIIFSAFRQRKQTHLRAFYSAV